MNYINTVTGAYPVTESEIRSANPNTSFPVPFQAPDDYALVFQVPWPEYDPLIRMVREVEPVLTDKGHYEQVWEVIPRFVEYTDDKGVTHSVEDQEAAAISEDQAQKAAQARAQAKLQRQAAVDAIQVTTQAGNTFDGDETSQTRMARAVLAMQATGTVSVSWVLADNSAIQATAAELTEALALAGAEQARLWVLP